MNLLVLTSHYPCSIIRHEFGEKIPDRRASAFGGEITEMRYRSAFQR